MLYILKIGDYLEILTDDEIKDFVPKNFNETIKKKNLRKVAKSLYIFLAAPDKVESNSSNNCAHHYNVEILNLFDPELQQSKSKELLSELKRFKVQTILSLRL